MSPRTVLAWRWKGSPCTTTSHGHRDGDQRRLRRCLRAHARSLGDRLEARSGGHGIDHLVHESAYEHWHGMLFARFLAENSLLIEPEMGVAITLDECEELAKDEGVDKWALAARFAHHMLPQVFRRNHPVFEVQFAREYRLKLEGLVEGLPAEVFTATDSLGWVYQFWQTKKKDAVNRSEVKIGADFWASQITQLWSIENTKKTHQESYSKVEDPCFSFLVRSFSVSLSWRASHWR